MSPKKFYPSGKTANSHLPPDLFPEFDRYRTEAARRRYVQDIMVNLARNDALFLTDLMNLGGDIVRISHEIIMGVRVDMDAGGHHVRADIPSEINRFKPHIKSMNGKPMEWKGGREVARQYSPGYGKHGTKPQDIYEDYWYGTETGEDDFIIQDAWFALKQAGKFCALAPSSRIQGKKWRMEEIPPPGYDAFFAGESDEPEAKQKGPKKMKAPRQEARV
jgi:hypothetical protein